MSKTIYEKTKIFYLGIDDTIDNTIIVDSDSMRRFCTIAANRAMFLLGK